MEKFLLKEPGSYRQLIRVSQELYTAVLPKVIVFSLAFSFFIFLSNLIVGMFGLQALWGEDKWSWFHLVSVGFNILGMWFLLALFYRIHCFVRNRHESYKDDLKIALRKLMLLFFAVILQNIIIIILAFFTIGLQKIFHGQNLSAPQDPAQFFLIACTFLLQLFIITYILVITAILAPIIATENLSFFQSIEKSFNIVWNHWWQTITLQIFPWIWYLAIIILIRLIMQIDVFLFTPHMPLHNTLVTLMKMVIFAGFVPWSAALLYVQLHDLELRKQIMDKNNKKNVKK